MATACACSASAPTTPPSTAGSPRPTRSTLHAALPRLALPQPRSPAPARTVEHWIEHHLEGVGWEPYPTAMRTLHWLGWLGEHESHLDAGRPSHHLRLARRPARAPPPPRRTSPRRQPRLDQPRRPLLRRPLPRRPRRRPARASASPPSPTSSRPSSAPTASTANAPPLPLPARRTARRRRRPRHRPARVHPGAAAPRGRPRAHARRPPRLHPPRRRRRPVERLPAARPRHPASASPGASAAPLPRAPPTPPTPACFAAASAPGPSCGTPAASASRNSPATSTPTASPSSSPSTASASSSTPASAPTCPASAATTPQHPRPQHRDRRRGRPDQHELWASHRVGGRARTSDLSYGPDHLEARVHGYRAPPRTTAASHWDGERLICEDRVEPRRPATMRLFFPESCAMLLRDNVWHGRTAGGHRFRLTSPRTAPPGSAAPTHGLERDEPDPAAPLPRRPAPARRPHPRAPRRADLTVPT
jgi:hypothetical protein